MSKPNRMGMNHKQLHESRKARYGNKPAPPDNELEAIMNRVEAREITPAEGARLVRELNAKRNKK